MHCLHALVAEMLTILPIILTKNLKIIITACTLRCALFLLTLFITARILNNSCFVSIVKFIATAVDELLQRGTCDQRLWALALTGAQARAI